MILCRGIKERFIKRAGWELAGTTLPSWTLSVGGLRDALISGEMDASICQFPATLISRAAAPLTCLAEGIKKTITAMTFKPEKKKVNTSVDGTTLKELLPHPTFSSDHRLCLLSIILMDDLHNFVRSAGRIQELHVVSVQKRAFLLKASKPEFMLSARGFQEGELLLSLNWLMLSLIPLLYLLIPRCYCSSF